MKKFFKVLFIMRYYLLSILIVTIILALLDIFVFLRNYHALYIILLITVSVLSVILIDGMTALFIHKLPRHLFNPERFKEYKWEKKFYQFIKIKKWKDKIPEIGELTCDFSKSKIQELDDPNYILMFLQEMGYAEVIHFLSCPLGFLIIFVIPLNLELFLAISLPVALINTFYNLLSALIQRYNRPKLERFYKRQLQLQVRKEKQ